MTTKAKVQWAGQGRTASTRKVRAVTAEPVVKRPTHADHKASAKLAHDILTTHRRGK